jgi:hypothetical protein
MEAKMRRLFLATSALAMLAALPVMAQNTMGAAPSSNTATDAPMTQQDRQHQQTMGSGSSQSMRSGSSMGSGSGTRNSDHAMGKHAARHANSKSSEVSETAQLNRDEANRLQSGNH